MAKVQVFGNVTRDPELKEINGEPVLKFGLAENDHRDKEAPPTFWDVDLWGVRAKALSTIIKKGDKIYASGTFSDRKHEGKTYYTIKFPDVELCGSPQGRREERQEERGRPAERRPQRSEYDDPPPRERERERPATRGRDLF